MKCAVKIPPRLSDVLGVVPVACLGRRTAEANNPFIVLEKAVKKSVFKSESRLSSCSQFYVCFLAELPEDVIKIRLRRLYKNTQIANDADGIVA